MGLQRKKEIYDICCEHGSSFHPPPLVIIPYPQLTLSLFVSIDIIICEDDPYFFLQIGEYVPKSVRKHQTNDADEDDAHFLAGLAPSYLR